MTASSRTDVDEVFARLANSTFRTRFRLNARDADYLRTRGLPTVIEHAERFITERLAPAEPRNDGKQTPMRGHPVFVAQHATATCCRSCLAKWHKIPAGRELSADEQHYVRVVVARWLEQIPDQ